MRTYSIKELENFSGVKAHTIRIWEQRYRLFTPSRTNTGIRFYENEDLKKILATAILLKSGYKISKIAKLSKDEIHNELSKMEGKNNLDESTKFETYINNLLAAGVQFLEDDFNSVYRNAKEKFSTFQIYTEIVYPLLVKIGTMWGKDDLNPLQEHFISNILRQKLLVEIDNMPKIGNPKKEVILFLPEKETHEIGLLLSNFILREAGIKTYYLGQQVPIANLITMINEKQIKEVVGFIFYSQGSEKLNKMLKICTENCPDTTFYWGGTKEPILGLHLDKNHQILNSIEDFKNKLI